MHAILPSSGISNQSTIGTDGNIYISDFALWIIFILQLCDFNKDFIRFHLNLYLLNLWVNMCYSEQGD